MTALTPSILYVASHCPGGRTYGAQLRVLQIGRLLRRVGKVELLLVADNPIEKAAIDEARGEFGDIQILPAPKRELAGFIDRLRHELDPGFLGTFPSAMDPADRATLLERAGKVDLVWIHSIRTANATGISRWPRSVLDIDDLPSLQYDSAAESHGSPCRRLLDLRMSWIWRRREMRLARRFDVLAVCSELDKRRLGGTEQLHVIRNGFDIPAPLPPVKSSKPRLGFIGTFNWEPNVEGIQWFVRSVLPAVRAAVPDVELRLVGTGSDTFPECGGQVQGLGYLDDPNAEIASWTAMFVPLRVSAGTRIKIAEGFAKRVPVVSTSVGAYGYDVTDGVEILLADEPLPFARSCIRLLQDPRLGERLSDQAFARFTKEWTWDAQYPSVKATIDHCLNTPSAVSR